MKNRLQFNRHYAVYPTREDALQALNNRITDPGFIPLIGEPIVLRYTDEQGNIQTILAIGKKAGSSLADRDYHVVDTAFIDKKIADEIAARLALSSATLSEIDRAQAKEDQIQDELDTTQTGAGLNADGTYKVNATANFINAATSLNGADVILDSTIKELSANTIAEDNALKDRATALENRKVLGSEAVKVNTENGNSTVSLAIHDFDKVLTQDNEGLRANITLTYVPNDKKIYLIGKENEVVSEIPTDDFIKDGMLSGASVVVADAALIQQYPEAGLVIGHKYLMLVFNTDTGSSVVFIGVDELVDVYTVNPNSDTYLDITNYVLTAKVDVEHGLAGYDLVRYVSGLTENIISGAGLNMLNPGQYPGHDETHYIKDATSLDNADVILDSVIFALSGAAAADLTELKENVRELSAVTEEVVEKVDNLSAYTVESIEALSAITSEISASTAVYTFRGDENGFITTQTETVVEAGKTVQRTTIKPTMPSSNWDDITGSTVAQGNGFATAYDVKQYVKDGIDGDAIWAGDMTLPIPSPTEENPLVGRINFDKDSPYYDTVHEAFFRTDNNFVRIAEELGTDSEGYGAHFYPSAKTEDCLLISDDRTFIDAIKTLDKAIDDMDWSGETTENEVFTGITQENGHVSATTKLLSAVKLSGYTVGGDDSGKLAETDTLGQALGKLQGQINGMDYSADTATDKVITAITQEDGKVVVESELLTERVVTGYQVGQDAKVAAIDTLGEALGKLQGQIIAMDKDNTQEIGKFVRTVLEEDGKVTEVKDYIQVSDLAICAATASEVTSLGANVKEAYRLVSASGSTTRLGEWIKIYKDSSIVEIYLGTSADTVNATTGVVTKLEGDKESLNYVYYTVNGTYEMVHIDLEDFLVEPEFKSGVTVTNHIAHGVVDPNSESFLTVGAAGFKLTGINAFSAGTVSTINSLSAGTIQLSADTKAAIASLSAGTIQLSADTKSTIAALSASVVTNKNNVTALSASVVTDRSNISAVSGSVVTNKNNIANLSGAVVTNKSNISSLSAGTLQLSADTTAAVAAAVAAGTLDSVAVAADGNNTKVTVKVGNTTKSGSAVVPYATNADTVDGFHIVTGQTGTAANTIYFL